MFSGRQLKRASERESDDNSPGENRIAARVGADAIKSREDTSSGEEEQSP